VKHFLVLLFLPFGLFAQSFERLVVEITRPANATAYTAGDVVCGTDSLPSRFVGSMSSGGGNGFIYSARMASDTNNSTNATFRLFLYADSVDLGKIADNAAHANSFARDSLLIGTIDFTLVATGSASGTVIYHAILDQPMPFKMPPPSSTSRGIWGRLTATGAWTPNVSGKVRLVLIVR